MLLIAGTLPIRDMPLLIGKVTSENGTLAIGGWQVPCMQGSAAMIGATLIATEYLGIDPPSAVVIGDIGEGRGSRQLYDYLIANIAEGSPDILTLHYWMPDMSQTRKLCRAIGGCKDRPIMIADAASMYSAKAAGVASEFDAFTPDLSEVAFLADPDATHPAYVSRHLFESDISRAPQLGKTAYEYDSAARLLLIKGAIDFVIEDGEVVAEITEPDIPVLEAIGGTGDTITGLLAALIFAGYRPREAAVIAARTNRMAGKYADVNPATRVVEIISKFPDVFKEYLCKWSSV